MTIEIAPVAAAIGAEVRGVDLTTPLDADTVARLRAAWRDHLVLIFRDQPLDHRQHIAFTRHFGELDDHASIPAFRDPDVHEILRVANDVVGGRKQPVGRQGHSDLSITLSKGAGIDKTGKDTLAAMTKVAAAARKNGLVAGAFGGSAEVIKTYLGLGYSFIAAAVDVDLMQAGAAELRKALAS